MLSFIEHRCVVSENRDNSRVDKIYDHKNQGAEKDDQREGIT